MSDFSPIGEKRNAPIWQVFSVLILLAALATGSFILGSKNPSQNNSSNGYADYTSSDQTYTEDPGVSDYSGNSDGGGTYVEQGVQLVNFIGFGSTDVERAIFQAGLRYYTRYTTGDPSLNARLNNGCLVVDQYPLAGTVVPLGSTVTILADCPNTGEW